MKKISWILLATFILGITFQDVCSATSSLFNRMSGLIDIPTAEIVPEETATFGLHGVSDPKGRSDSDWDGNVYFGLVNRAELGLTLFGKNEIVGNVKFLLQKRGDPSLAVAIGMENIGGKISTSSVGYGKECSLYAVISKHFGTLKDFSGHLGIGSGRFVGHGPISKKLGGVFFGVKREFLSRRGNILAIMAEVDGRDVNAGARYSTPKGLGLNLAVAEIDNLLKEHREAGLNVTYCLGVTWSIPTKKELRISKKPAVSIVERAARLEEEIVNRGVIEQGLERYLTSENIRMDILKKEEIEEGIKLCIQIKNVGQNPIYTNPNYFTLVDKEGNRSYYSAQTFSCPRPFLGGKLWPGRETEGNLVFAATGSPKELVYNDGWKNFSSQQIR